MQTFCLITITLLNLACIWYYIAKLTTTSIKFRVLYYKPTGEAIGIIYLFHGETDFYFYQEDLQYRTSGLAIYETERFLRNIQKQVKDQKISLLDFHKYFEDNFYISSIVPMVFFKSAQYSIKRDILKAYKHHKIEKETKALNEIN